MMGRIISSKLLWVGSSAWSRDGLLPYLGQIEGDKVALPRRYIRWKMEVHETWSEEVSAPYISMEYWCHKQTNIYASVHLLDHVYRYGNLQKILSRSSRQLSGACQMMWLMTCIERSLSLQWLDSPKVKQRSWYHYPWDSSLNSMSICQYYHIQKSI